jgi:hypothetical protein
MPAVPNSSILACVCVRVFNCTFTSSMQTYAFMHDIWHLHGFRHNEARTHHDASSRCVHTGVAPEIRHMRISTTTYIHRYIHRYASVTAPCDAFDGRKVVLLAHEHVAQVIGVHVVGDPLCTCLAARKRRIVGAHFVGVDLPRRWFVCAIFISQYGRRRMPNELEHACVL